jgi:hypothetical protein
MTHDDLRAQFIIAQHLIESGRVEEARLLLRSLADVPEAQDWADRIEAGEPVDPFELQWEAGRPYPEEPPVHLPRFQPMRFAMSVFLALMLLTPVLQMIAFSARHAPTTEARLARAAQVRVQLLCESLVQQAIAEHRLKTEFGSCMEWSLNLTDAAAREVMRCHTHTPGDDNAFRRCVLDADLFPAELLPVGQSA